MNGAIYENFIFNIKYDKDKNLFIIPIDSVNSIFDKLEPYCRKKRLNLVGVPEFVHKIVKNPSYKLKEKKVKQIDKRKEELMPNGKLRKIQGVDQDRHNSELSEAAIEEERIKQEDEKEEQIHKIEIAREKTIEDLPKELYDKLFDFQREGVNYGISKGGRFLLGDEMGVGKTIQALAVSYIYKCNWPLLVICPASLKYTWREEAVKWLPRMEECDVHILEHGKEKFNLNCCIFVVSYDLAAKRA